MTRRLRLAWLPLLLVPLAAAEPPSDKESIQGEWVFSSAEIDGKLVEDERELAAFKKVQMTFKGDRVTMTGVKGDATFSLDEKVTPKTLDLKATFEGKAKVLPMLYELDGDKLRLCYFQDPMKTDRPREFSSKNGLMVLTLKRSRP